MKTDTPEHKMLFVLPALAAGGAERVLITFMNGADKAGYDPVFLSVRDEGALSGLIDPGIPRHTLGRNSVFGALLPLYKKLRNIKPDIVISTMAHMNFALLMLRPFFPRTKFIVREAITPSYFYGKYKMRGFLIKSLYRFLYPKADMVLSPTQKVFDEFSALGMSGEQFFVIRNPVDLEAVRVKPLANKDTVPETVRFVCCGRLDRQKGFDRLIAALGAKPLSFSWNLDIIGEGPEHNNLQNLIEAHQLQNNVTLCGFQKEPYGYFAQADYFLMPSRFEGLPNVVLESLACGTPVIATAESGGIDEIARDTAPEYLKIAGDMDDFLALMRTVKPHNKTDFAPSLLPVSYEKQQVIGDFYKLIDKVVHSV